MGLLVGGVFDVEPGDLLVPHLYDWSFDGVDDYVVVGLRPDGSGTPFVVYGWSEITISERIYPVWPKANIAWSKTSMLGDLYSDVASTFFIANNRVDYTAMSCAFVTRKADGSSAWYSVSVYAYRNTWVHVVRMFTSARVLSFWLNGARVYNVTIPSTEYTVLEWNPDTATYPERYRRFMLGANVVFTEWMTLYQSYLAIHSRALNDSEIQQVYNASTVPGTGLALLLDATFWDGSKFVDLSGNGNHGYPYGGVQRVPAEQRFVLHVKGRFSDGIPRLAVPGRCTYMFDCSWRENRGDSPVFVELQPGRRLILIETLD